MGVLHLPEFSLDKNEAQTLLLKSSTSCILAQVDNNIVLALAGCGIDFSWQICKAYMLLGYLLRPLQNKQKISQYSAK